ncbi:hypothetical protein [Pectinatus frisingensis]|uniref:hypothetical protein n=1 Tax=Pectinatus frisingensis TaxID=865 RepID=UPI0018C6E459|nr:hypothetical protein [Pectinatus frisingensis]
MMNESCIPSINLEDKINTSLLEPHTLPGLIVEGKTDISIYDKMFSSSKVLSTIDFIIGESKSAIITAYKSKTINFPCVILLDKDYDGYLKSCLTDDNIVYTHYYTMENYLTTEAVIDATNKDFQSLHRKFSTNDIIKEVKAQIEPYVIFCLIKLKQHWDIKLEECNIVRWLEDNNLKAEELRDYILGSLKKIGIKESKVALNEKYDEEKLLFEKADKYQQEEVTHGKQKLAILFYVFKSKYNDSFEKRNVDVFTVDLLKNISCCDAVNELTATIEEKIKPLLH